jgi:predicted nucleic acid-binding protein
VLIFDTDIVSNFRKKKLHPNLLAWFSGVERGSVAVSAFTVFEINVGVELVRRMDPDKAEQIEKWLESFVIAGGFDLLPFDARVGRIYARMFTTPGLASFLLPDRNSKKPKSGADLIVAATAIVHGAAVVTANKNDFLRINEFFPLPALYDPFGMEWAVGGAES